MAKTKNCTRAPRVTTRRPRTTFPVEFESFSRTSSCTPTSVRVERAKGAGSVGRVVNAPASPGLRCLERVWLLSLLMSKPQRAPRTEATAADTIRAARLAVFRADLNHFLTKRRTMNTKRER